MFTFNRLVDTLGIWTSSICAVHCLFMPVLISLSAFSSLVFLHHPKFESTIISASAILGAGSLIPSYVRHHRKLTPIIVLVVGFLIIGASRLTEGASEALLTFVGAMTIATAHYINMHLSRKHKSCR